MLTEILLAFEQCVLGARAPHPLQGQKSKYNLELALCTLSPSISVALMNDATNLRLCSTVVFTMEKSAKRTCKVQTHGAQWSTVLSS